MDWHDELREAFRTPEALAELLQLEDHLLPRMPDLRQPFLVTRPFASRMRPKDPRDPLLLQVWPDDSEAVFLSHESQDPTGDLAVRPVASLLRKYPRRALWILTGACAIHCRYCFRREFPYHEVRLDACSVDVVLRELAGDSSLREIILSGGDPLTLPDFVLSPLIDRLEEIPHLRFLRLHTRLPVVLPTRVTQALRERLGQSRFDVTVVLHVNHPAELDEAVAEAAHNLRLAGIRLLNQTVMLRGINDTLEILEDLCWRLGSLGITPYYLHALDPVRGSNRFQLPDSQVAALAAGLRERLPGWLAPRAVREIPGRTSKALLHP